jgi:hypothetical protein
MSLGGKVFTTVWEQLFQIFFPGGFLTVEFGWYFALGALAISSITLLLQINVLEKKVLIRRVIVNVCLLAVSLFIPALLGFIIGILVSGAFYSIKQHPDLPLVNKIAIGVLNALGILGLLGVCGIFIFFWRFLVAYMIAGGFIVGILIYIVPVVQNFIGRIFQEITLENFKKITITSGILFLVLGGLFASFGFVRPFKAAPESYSPSGTMNVTLVTYNIRLGTGREENQYDLWKERKDDLADYIDSFDAKEILV